MVSLNTVAYHEAGHAVAAWRVGADIESVSAELGGGRLVLRGPRGLPWREFLDKKLLLILAGPAAQRFFDPTSHVEYGAIHDYSAAENLLSLGFGSDTSKAVAVFEAAQAAAADLVGRERHVISALASELTAQRYLDGATALDVMRSAEAANGSAIGP